MRARRVAWGIGIVTTLAVLPPLAFYGWSEFDADRIIRNGRIDGRYRNAVKHSLAASHLYSGLRWIGVQTRLAEELVLGCGFLNEFGELYVKRGRPDSTQEIAKDLRSNLIGVTMARWLESRQRISRSDAIVALVRSNILEPAQAANKVLPPAGRDGYWQALAQHEVERRPLTVAVETVLGAL